MAGEIVAVLGLVPVGRRHHGVTLTIVSFYCVGGLGRGAGRVCKSR